MQTLAIDIETYSSVDLAKGGVYKYVQAPDFSIILFAWAFNNEPVQVVSGVEPMGAKFFDALTDPYVLKTAHNAAFERICLQKYFNTSLPVNQWQCTMSLAAMAGLPLSLDAASKALDLHESKDAKGKGLIRYFCMPCKPTKANGGRTRNLPTDAPDKWEEFKNYCKQDVVVEQAIRAKLIRSEAVMSASEHAIWCLDQKINDTGVLLDRPFVKHAINLNATYIDRLTKEAVELTQLENPNSAAQLKAWLTNQIGSEVESLKKGDIPELLKTVEDSKVKRVLNIRQEMAKTSVKKYVAMLNCVGADNRVRGLLQYYGANRTGRWAGRLVQVQNLPQNHLVDLDLAREIVATGELDWLELMYGNVPDTLSQLIRTAFVAPKGCRLLVADLSAIEARVIAWLAGEKWRLNVFNTHGKIYEASASQMFKVPIEKCGKGSEYRQRGKIAELALGYQGGPGALVTMGAIKMGVPEAELPKLVKMWRNANPAIVNYWYRVNDAAVEAIESGEPVTLPHGLKFYTKQNCLYIQLPSGRKLCYLKPKLVDGQYGQIIKYQGVDQTTKSFTWLDTYGGKLVENIVQATARDVLAEGLLNIDAAGYKIIMHVHDEIVCEMPEGIGSVEEMCNLMAAPLDWAKGLPLKADGYETTFYKKD